MKEIIDLDKPDSWPDPISAVVAEWAGRLEDSTEFTNDLSNQLLEIDDGFRALFDGSRLLAYHCSRLTDQEAALIQNQGLRALRFELVKEKIDLAHAHGFLKEDDRVRLLSGNVYAVDNLTGREDKVCLVAGERFLDREAHGLSPLLRGWGGEATHGWPGPDRDSLLRTIGSPSIVVAGIDVNSGDPAASVFPGLAKAFVGVALGLPDAGCEIHLFADIPGADIVGIWQPGDAKYDRHTDLPQE